MITAKAHTSDGGEKEVISDLSYYYCPHFAKTAVNPNIDVDENGKIVGLF